MVFAAHFSMQNPESRIQGRGFRLFILGWPELEIPTLGTTARVFLVARDLGTHDREWSISVVLDRTASVTSRPHLDWLVMLVLCC